MDEAIAQPLPTNINNKAHRSPSPIAANNNNGRRLIRPRQEDDIPHQTISAHEIPNGGQSNNIPPTSNRNALLAFLFFVGIAIMHAIASGFENMHHESKKKQQLLDNSQFIQENTDYVISSTNSNEALNGRSVEDELDNTKAYYGEEDEDDKPVATILSRSSQLSNILHLDASDVVECYIVTRMAPLTNVAASGSVGGNNNNDSTKKDNDGNRRRRVKRMLDQASGSKDIDDKSDTMEDKDDDDDSSSTITNNIPSGPILVRKSALAFRYRPRVASISHGSHSSSVTTDNQSPWDEIEQHKYFELTLEFGPQRTGVTKASESVPLVHADMVDGTIGKYVSWENEGRVYHSTTISSEWTEAYYMASITGVVLEKIIQRAVDFTYKRPRYQPFEVVSIPSQNLLLRSSGSDDFVWEMFRDLAELYVDIDPLLVPPRSRVQFYVADPEEDDQEDDVQRVDESNESNNVLNNNKDTISTSRRKQPNPNVKKVREASQAAAFYEKFFNCAHAIKSGDYSLYLPPPTVAPTAMPTDSISPSAMPSGIGSDNKMNMDVDKVDGEKDYEDSASLQDDSIPDSSLRQNTTEDDYVQNTTSQYDDDGQRRVEYEENHINTTMQAAVLDKLKSNPVDIDEENENSTVPADLPPQNSHDTDDSDDSDDAETIQTSEDDPAEVAEKAAIEAAKAAENAAVVVATNSSSAADTAAATIEASKAAQKAKEASVAARSQASAEALLSGDGDLVTSVLSNCFSDPKYGIRRQEEVVHDRSDEEEEGEGNDEVKDHGSHNKDSSVTAYLYLDGDVFFRLNLVAPYLGVVSSKITVPPPKQGSEGKGDAIDWMIFMLILMGTLFGFLVMIHQVGIVIDKRLRFRRIFHPTMTESDFAYEDNCVEQSPLKGGGFSHSELRMDIENIPTSMGGGNGQSMAPPTDYHNDPAAPEDSINGIDLEMAAVRSPISPHHVRMNSGMVERPSLKSSSIVAMPKLSPREDQQNEKKIEFKSKNDMPKLPLDELEVTRNSSTSSIT